jgi:hypothetical protein
VSAGAGQLAGALAVLLVALLPLVRSYVQTKVTPEKLSHVPDIARVAVRGAEQLGVGNLATGADKAAFASTVVAEGAKRLGLKLSDDEAAAFVHAAVLEMKQINAAPSPAPA